VGQINGQFVVNPTYQQLQQSDMDLVIEASPQGVLSVEGGFHEVSEQRVHEAIVFGNEQAMKLVALQQALAKQAGRPKAQGLSVFEAPEAVLKAVRERALPALKELTGAKSKDARETVIEQLRTTLVKQLAPAGGTVTEAQVLWALQTVEREDVRRFILESGARVDGRGYTDLRQITCEIGVLPRTHGSGLFTRGETQSLSVTTLGTSDDEQLVEALEGESRKRFMLHYNFPPFSVGEVRPVRSPGRREIGHGALAERALAPMIPTKEAFPYTVRVVSDILESNGSSSMATVCAGTLSLMDAGVPMQAPVAGVAMGLVKEGARAKILTDIAGLEDHFGDMDFKVAGTRKGITAVQADVKLSEGLPLDLIREILAQAHPARMTVLDRMAETIDKPKATISAYAPRIVTIKINPERIRDLIGPGGRTIRKIIEETGVTINVEDDGSVDVASSDAQKTDKALAIIHSLTEDVEVGKIYVGKVKRIMNFGAFCEILPGKEGLVHVSELDDKYVKKVEEVVKVGDEIRVQVIEIDEQGRVNLSRKRLMEPAASSAKSEAPAS
jgi:polyribonucleotide nucleotidyltransferase